MTVLKIHGIDSAANWWDFKLKVHGLYSDGLAFGVKTKFRNAWIYTWGGVGLVRGVFQGIFRLEVFFLGPKENLGPRKKMCQLQTSDIACNIDVVVVVID